MNHRIKLPTSSIFRIFGLSKLRASSWSERHPRELIAAGLTLTVAAGLAGLVTDLGDAL